MGEIKMWLLNQLQDWEKSESFMLFIEAGVYIVSFYCLVRFAVSLTHLKCEPFGQIKGI